MRLSKVVSDIRGYIRPFDYCGEARVINYDGHGTAIFFPVRTTKTRASSMVSRIKLIVAEAADGRDFFVSKELLGDLPRDRSSLCSWEVMVSFPKKEKKNARGVHRK